MGQQICHIINDKLPHVSNTKFNAVINKFEQKNSPIWEQYYCKPFYIKDKIYKKSSFKKRKIIDTFNSIDKLGQRIQNARRMFNYNDYTNKNSIAQLKCTKLGNCYEDAKAAELILKMNGINNSATATLRNGDCYLDHAVCIFNRDGSKIEKVINNKTIIIDPWSGIVDFANNGFNKMKYLFKDRLFLTRDSDNIKINKLYTSNLSKKDISELKNKYPELILENKKTR